MEFEKSTYVCNKACNFNFISLSTKDLKLSRYFDDHREKEKD